MHLVPGRKVSVRVDQAHVADDRILFHLIEQEFLVLRGLDAGIAESQRSEIVRGQIVDLLELPVVVRPDERRGHVAQLVLLRGERAHVLTEQVVLERGAQRRPVVAEEDDHRGLVDVFKIVQQIIQRLVRVFQQRQVLVRLPVVVVAVVIDVLVEVVARVSVGAVVLHRDVIYEERLAFGLILIKIRDEPVVRHVADVVAQSLVTLIVVDRVKLVEAHVVVNDIPLPVLGQIRMHGHGAPALLAQDAREAVFIVLRVQVIRRSARRQERRAVSGQDHVLRSAGAGTVHIHMQARRERVLVRVEPVEYGPDVLADFDVPDVAEVGVALVHDEDDVRRRDVLRLRPAFDPVREFPQRVHTVAVRRGNDHVPDRTERVQHVAVRLIALGQTPVTHGDPAVREKLRKDQQTDKDDRQNAADDRSDQMFPSVHGFDAAFAGKHEQRPGHQQRRDHAVGKDPAVGARHGERGVRRREIVGHDRVAFPARDEIIRDAVAREDDLQQHRHDADAPGQEPEETEDRVKDGNVITPGVVLHRRGIAVRGLECDQREERGQPEEQVLRDLPCLFIACFRLLAQIRRVQVEQSEEQQQDAACAQDRHRADAVMEERDRERGLSLAQAHLVMERGEDPLPALGQLIQPHHRGFRDLRRGVQRVDRKDVGLALLEVDLSDREVHGHVLALPLQADVLREDGVSFLVRDRHFERADLIAAVVYGEGDVDDVAVNRDDILRDGTVIHQTHPRKRLLAAVDQALARDRGKVLNA